MRLTALTISFILITCSTFAQTSVLQTKSRGGELADVNRTNDNFGLDPSQEPGYNVKKIKLKPFEMVQLIDDHCYVHYKTNKDSSTDRDTICNSRYFEKNGYTKEAATKRFGSDVVISGFPEKAPDTNNSEDDGAHFWINGSPFENRATGIVALIFLSLALYTFRPLLNKKQ